MHSCTSIITITAGVFLSDILISERLKLTLSKLELVLVLIRSKTRKEYELGKLAWSEAELYWMFPYLRMDMFGRWNSRGKAMNAQGNLPFSLNLS